MTKEDISKIKDLPGIYYIKNIINGKYYIGQSVFIKRRLYHHYSNYNTQRYDAPLYRAMLKYGIDNFECGVIESFDTTDYSSIKPKLDELEKEYIQKYNSYGATGYNQTQGGDAGILGYKFTKEQKKHVSVNSKLSASHKNIYVYDVNTGCTYFAISINAMSNILEGNPVSNRSQLSRNLDKQKLYKHYIVSSTKEVFTKDYINLITNCKQRIVSGENKLKYTIEEYYKQIKTLQIEKEVPP